ncbi:MAG: hypothetical protein LBR22_03250 [Desulfovibrio sp.]|nr:hypothetical protein [Desulfovibrio sp.]
MPVAATGTASSCVPVRVAGEFPQGAGREVRRSQWQSPDTLRKPGRNDPVPVDAGTP